MSQLAKGKHITVHTVLLSCVLFFLLLSPFLQFSCTIQNSIICAGAIIESGCNLNECYIGAGAVIAANSKLKSESVSARDI